MEVAKIMMGSDATIMLFVVDGSMRGLGLGRKLITHFRSYAGRMGAKHVSLYTDVESNWKFYEKTGFKRVADFRDAFLSFYKQEEIRSFVYQIASIR
jgi:ribosomal protein S18 acetylase RimI-like enzyme